MSESRLAFVVLTLVAFCLFGSPHITVLCLKFVVHSSDDRSRPTQRIKSKKFLQRFDTANRLIPGELLAERDSDSQEEAVHRSYTTENDSQLWSTDSVAGSEPSSSINPEQAPQHPGLSQQRALSRLRGRVDNEPRTIDPCMDGVIDGPSASPYIMNILIEPPNQIRPGHLLSPPLILRLDQPPCEHSQAPSPNDPTLLWAVVSLFSADSETPIAPPQIDLLLGNPVDSVHPLAPEIPGREVGFVSFPDLSIREPGRYRLQISLIRMNSVGPSSNAPPFEGGTNMQHTFTRVINVDPEAEPPSLGQEERAILNSLQQRGLRV